MSAVTLARHAMNTRFEVVLHGDDPVRLRAIAEAALDEISRIEAQLSAYSPRSELTQINLRAGREPVRVEPGLFRLLQHTQRLTRETDGAFDLTVAPLMRCWGFVRDKGRLPDPAEVEAARAAVGMQFVELHEHNFTVRFTRPGMTLDSGAIGKGFALDAAAQIVREAELTSALLHGGTSSVCAIGAPPDAESWKVAIERPPTDSRSDEPARPLAVVRLRDESLSVSAVWGKGFEANGRFYGHVLDPRRGEPVEGALLAAVVSASGTEAEAFSTALLTLGADGFGRVNSLRPGMRSLLLLRADGPGAVLANGIDATDTLRKA